MSVQVNRYAKPVYKPEEWRETYLENPLFNQSIKQVERITGLSHSDAEDKLMDMLLKATCVEFCIQANGVQKAEELFENLGLFTGEKTTPFHNVDELKEFLASMDLIFILNRRRKDYRNSGTGFRKFVQNLVVKLTNGDQVHGSDVKDLLKEHFAQCEIGVVEGKYEAGYINFLQKEVLVDFESLKRLSVDVKGFNYDPKTEEIKLNEDAAGHLPLHLPIVQKLFSTGCMDLSRVTTGVLHTQSKFNGCENGIITQGLFAGSGYNFSKKFIKIAMGGDKTSDMLLLAVQSWFKGVLHPNNRRGAVEVFETVMYSGNLIDTCLSPGTVSTIRLEKGLTHEVDFGAIMDNMAMKQKERFAADPKYLFREDKKKVEVAKKADEQQ